MPKSKIFAFLVTFFLIFPPSAHAFQYPSLPSDNLIQNPWFRSADCQNFSSLSWNLNAGEAPWGGSDKTQDPTDVNCKGIWWGYAARFADNNNAGGSSFYPDKDAKLTQIVGPVSATNKTLHFHSLIVAHRVNQYKAEIYGSNNPIGPWTSVWKPFDISCNDNPDCVNNAPGGGCNTGNRECLWAEVTEYFLGSLNPLIKTISQSYPYYKIEFLMNYPPPDGSATGDVGGKLARVYFKVSGGTDNPTNTPTLTGSPSINFKQLLHSWLTSSFDQNNDGKLNSLDFLKAISQP